MKERVHSHLLISAEMWLETLVCVVFGEETRRWESELKVTESKLGRKSHQSWRCFLMGISISRASRRYLSRLEHVFASDILILPFLFVPNVDTLLVRLNR